MKDHVDFIKRKYRELDNKLKGNGVEMTPQRQKNCLFSEFGNEENDELGDKVLQKPQIAKDALKILKAEDGNSTHSRMVPVDYFIADSDLEYKFDLHQLAKEWIRTKDMPEKNKKEKYIAPYFCFIQSSGMGNTKLMYEFSQLTRKTSSDAHQDKKNFSMTLAAT
jgi:hypothetical protein